MLFRAEIILKSQIKKVNDELNVGRLKLEVQKKKQVIQDQKKKPFKSKKQFKTFPTYLTTKKNNDKMFIDI